MFVNKFEEMKKQQFNYLITESEYHNLIEALLFKEQKKCFDSIEYSINGVNKIIINILKSKKITKINLPYFDSDLMIWKSKLYTIQYIKENSKKIIDKYNIIIKEVDQLKFLNNNELNQIKEENEKLKKEIEELKKEIKSLNQIKEENEKFKKEIKFLNQIGEKNKEIKQENKIEEPKIINYTIENLDITDDNIINEKPFVFQISPNDVINFTISDLIANNYIIRKNNIELQIISIEVHNPTTSTIEFTNNEFIFNYYYSKDYENTIVKFPYDQNITYQLIDSTKYLVYQKSNYNVCIYITLV